MTRPGSRGRSWAIVSTTLGSILLVATVVIFRDRIQEEWWISRLGAKDPKERKTAAAKLGGVGRERGARALLEVLRARYGPGDGAVDSLAKIFNRVRPPVQAEIVRGLLAAGRFMEDGESEWKSPEGFNPDLREVLDGLDPRAEEVFAALRDELRQEKNGERAMSLLANSWPHCREYLSRWFTGEPPEEVLKFYRSLRSVAVVGRFGDRDPEADLIRSFAFDHPEPHIRAVSLAYGVTYSPYRGPTLGTEALGQAYSRDPHPLVKTAAIRIAGWIGDVPGNLDLKSLLFQEEDPWLLEEIIRARSLWIPDRGGGCLEVCEGAIVCWDLEGLEGPKARALEPEEIERLKDLLKREKAPSLRDAASQALTARGFPVPPEDRQRFPDLKVHEWGVWRDGGDRLLPGEDLVADLPPFVHRSRVTVKNLRRHRKHQSSTGVTFKPVVFFYSPDPITVQVRVEFTGGRPWTFYPEITDYVEGTSVGEPESPNGPTAFDARGLNPPWPLDPEPEAAPEREDGNDSDEDFLKAPEGELRTRYAVASWIINKYANSFLGNGLWGSMGVEWFGLRVGYGPGVEGSFAPVEDASWWSSVREVPCSPVALRGNHERFLFYDGTVQLPSPVLVSFADEEQKSIRLRFRVLRDYAGVEYWLDVPPTQYLPGLFVIRKEAGSPLRGRFIPQVPPGAKPITVDLGSLPLDEQALRSQLDASLRGEGLTPEETRALLRTWEKEFFGPGLRVLTVLPGWLYQHMLRMVITPEPGELVRVGLVWKECEDLEVDSVPDREAAQKAASPPRPFSAKTRELQFTREALHPQPSGQFELAPDGLLSGLPPGNEKVLLSGDGRQLVWARHHEPSPAIYLADPESKAVTRLVDLSPEMYVSDYSVSSDGDQIAFIAEGGRFRVRVASARKGEVLEIYSTEDRIIPPWIHLAAGGKKLVFFENRIPVVVDLESRRATFIEIPGSEELRCPFLTPDGSRLVLLSAPESAGSEDCKALVVDLGRGTFVEAESKKVLSMPPCLSADGSRLIFVGMEDETAFVGFWNLASGNRVRLASLRFDAIPPSLTADGKTVLFLLYGRLWTTGLQTGRSREALSLEGREIRSFTASADGRRVLLRSAEFGVADSERLHVLELKKDQ